MQWLNENDDVSLEFLHSAYARDKKDNVIFIQWLLLTIYAMYSNPICIPLQFQKNTEHSNFSNSVVDVFTQLTQCFEVLQKLECQDDQIWNRYMKRFAKTVVKVLIAYADVLKNDFPVHVRNEPIVSPPSD